MYTYTKLLNDMKLYLGLGLFLLMAINGYAQSLVASTGTTINVDDCESSNGSCFKIIVDNAGQLVTQSISCP